MISVFRLLVSVAQAQEPCEVEIPMAAPEVGWSEFADGDPLPEALVALAGGRPSWQDETGRRFDRETTRRILATWEGENPDRGAPVVGGTVSVMASGSWDGVGIPMVVDPDTPGSHDIAVRRRHGGVSRLDHAEFDELVCAYNADRQHIRERQRARDALHTLIRQTFPGQPVPTLEVFETLERGYAALGRVRPRDPRRWLADAEAVRDARNRGAGFYDFEAAWTDAREAGSGLPVAELVASLPVRR